MSVLVTGRAHPRLLDGLHTHGVSVRRVQHPQISDFDGISRVYHVSDEFDPAMTTAADQVFALAVAAGVSLVGWQSRIGPYDVAAPGGRHFARTHEALWHLGVPFFIAQPAYPLEWIEEWTSGGLVASPVAPDAVLPWVGMDEVAGAAASLLSRPDHEGGIYELCRRHASVRELAPDGLRVIAADRVVGMPAEDAEAASAVFARLSRGVRNGNSAILDWLLKQAGP